MIGKVLGFLGSSVSKATPVGIALNVVEDIFTDEAQKEKAALRVAELNALGELKKTEIGLTEAKSADPFRSRWRPAVGWICAGGLAYSLLVAPLGNFLTNISFLVFTDSIHTVPLFPSIDPFLLVTALGGVLGMGTLRSHDKRNSI